MISWTNFVAGVIQAFNLTAGRVRDDGLVRRGAERAELDPLKCQKSVRSKADEVGDRPLPDRDRAVLYRL